MITLSQLCQFLESTLNMPPINDYCPNGLQVEGKESIYKIGTAVSASFNTIQQAVEKGVDALVVHHGLFWKGDNYVISGAKRKKLQLLMENGISLLGYHLPLDKHLEVGNNWKAARDLGWEDLKPFGNYNGILIGVKGNVAPTSPAHFKKQLETYYNHPATVVFGGKQEIKRAALISGGAHKSIEEAIDIGVDAFITGSFDEPTWHQAHESGINFYAMGHSATERIGPLALNAFLQETFGIPSIFIEDANPF